MALSRWRWVWVPMLLAILLAIVLLPGSRPSQGGVFFWLFQPGEYRHVGSFHEDVRAALRVQRRRLQLAERADSIIGAARGPRALRARDGAVIVIYEPPLTADSARLWLQAALSELARYPQGTASGVPVIVALYSNPARASTRDFEVYQWAARRILPDAFGTPCIVEVNLVPPARRPGAARSWRRPPSGSVLGLCSLYQRFGAPGTAVAAWAGRLGWTGDWSADAGWQQFLSEARRSVPRREIPRPRVVDVLQGVTYWYWGTPWTQIGCVDGTLSLCARNVRIAPGGTYDVWWYSDSRGVQLIAYLLSTGTPAQFADFWRSPLGVSDGLQQAFGRPAGQLAYEAYSHWYYAEPAGPRAGSRLVLAGLFWAGAALALAIVAGRRWKTEI